MKNELLFISRLDSYLIKIIEILKQKGEKEVCYLALNKTADSLQRELQTKISTKKFYFLDGITKSFMNAKETKNCFFLDHPIKLGSIQKQVKMHLITRKNCTLIIDALSDLLIYGTPFEDVCIFLDKISNYLRKIYGESLIVCDKIYQEPLADANLDSLFNVYSQSLWPLGIPETK